MSAVWVIMFVLVVVLFWPIFGIIAIPSGWIGSTFSIKARTGALLFSIFGFVVEIELLWLLFGEHWWHGTIFWLSSPWFTAAVAIAYVVLSVVAALTIIVALLSEDDDDEAMVWAGR